MIVEIVEALKERATIFSGRIAAAAEFSRLQPDGHLALPSVYVIPFDDSATNNESESGYQQEITDTVAVIVVLDNKEDDLSKVSAAQIIGIRNVLFKALLSWEPDAEHGPITYDGGSLLDVNRAHFYYQFEFSAKTEIGEADTWQAVENAGQGDANVGDFEQATVTVDMTDPSITGEPDGNPEAIIEIDVPQI